MDCLSITAGKVAMFKAVVSGDPTPTVTWARNKGDTSDPEKYKPRYDEKNREHVLEVTYQCQTFGSEITTLSCSTLNMMMDPIQSNDCLICCIQTDSTCASRSSRYV